MLECTNGLDKVAYTAIQGRDGIEFTLAVTATPMVQPQIGDPHGVQCLGEGEFDTVTTLDGRVRDLIEAVRTLKHVLGYPFRLGLFGSSLGGTTCLAAASELNPDRMVTLAAPVDSRSLLARAQANPAGTLPPVFATDAFQFDLAGRLENLGNLLVIHGEADEVVPVEHARKIYGASHDPKRLLINPGGDHRVTNPRHQEIFIEACRNWFQTLLTAPTRKTGSC